MKQVIITIRFNTLIECNNFKIPVIIRFLPVSPRSCILGDSISEGSVICVIEAMKLFNEIESEVSGKIVKVLVEDSMPVEFDQPLFLIDPS